MCGSYTSIGLIPFEFWCGESQLRELEEDMFVKDIEWAALTTNKELKGMFFENETLYMVIHLKPLFIKATINGKMLSRVFVYQSYP